MIRYRSRLRRALGVVLPLALTSACSPGYVLRASWEEAKILSARRPIVEVIRDRRTDAETRGKLALVLEARAFARDSLGLRAGESYTLFSQVRSDTLAMVLSAAPKDAFRAHTWWFPVVGRVPYKGFFDPADAEAEARRLEAQGFDTYVRPTAAFSTLGWFRDPLLSTLLRYDDVSLGNTVIHELTHNTYFAPGQVAFNESFASFVGGRGAVHFFCAMEGADGPRCRNALAQWEDDLVMGRFMEEMVAELDSLYARHDVSRQEKLARREEIFDAARERYRREVQPQFQAGSYGSFLTSPLNNATLISRRLYYQRLELFDAVYRTRDRDLRRTVRDIIAAARSNRADPYAAVEALLD
jgi:predicted aminopeptidase